MRPARAASIKRVAQALDARAYTDLHQRRRPRRPELAHPFLWRYWTRLPKAGHVGIYDRSWYGRVLVERVEGFATPRPVGPRLRRDQRVRARSGGPVGRHPAQVLGGRQLPKQQLAPLPGARERSRRSSGRSPQRTGAIAIVILNIMQPFRICSVLPRLLKHRGLSLRAMTSSMRASKRSRPINQALEERLKEFK